MPKFLCILILLCSFAFVKTDAQIVYKTPSGKKYHLSTCRMVENVSQKLSVKEALQKGLEPCKICNPGQAGLSSENKKLNPPRETVQCRGITKAGTRCRHRTSMSNGYCFQHSP